ncbi:hypothetical protein KEJ21_05275 [Candidatus Bathyarchaeota archaeon]|nr:hypothetical protein [Candidatus Bathyarchaeota archaeon]MBS7631484.1 hypothetical protein [Candidatus Bathyarchaeota archaeon]
MVIPLLERLWQILLDLTPKIIGAIVVLVVGWIFGRLMGSLVRRAFQRARIEHAFHKTTLGKALERSGFKSSVFFDMVVRWFIYFGAILIAIDFLGIEALESFLNNFLQYIPIAIGGVFIFIIGLIIADFLADLALAASKEAKLEYASFFILCLRLIMYFMVAVIAFTIMKIDVSILHIFANALAWGVAAGLGVGLGVAFGWGFKDAVAKNADKWIKTFRTAAEVTDKTVELQALKDKIRDLEAIVAEKNEKIETLSSVRMELLEELTAPVENLHARLEELIGSKGKVLDVYGGHKITVLEPSAFPWFEVLVTLVSRGLDVWLTKEEDKFVIKSKEPSAS